MINRMDAFRALTPYGQEHVLRWFDELNEKGQACLLAQIETLDLAWLSRAMALEPERIDPREILPCSEVIQPGHRDETKAIELGEEALREGRVGVLLVAGGQGTRLGYQGAKGAFPIGAVSGRTLYQIHVDRVVALGKRYGAVPPLYVMTSEATHQETVALFKAHHHWGLHEDRLLIFAQGQVPAADETGKLLLDARDHMVMAPNGNGGVFCALKDSGALDHMQRSGVEALSYLHVDNPLGQSCDAHFVGCHLLRKSHFSCKAIKKNGPKEKVGCFARVKGKLRILEYTEIPSALVEKTAQDGELLFNYSNPGLFMWSREFVIRQAARQDLPYHKAHKKIPHLDQTGQWVQPDTPCGYKFESFAMDTLPDAEQSLLVACDRDKEFAPVKNASGEDSPVSAQALMTQLYASWIEKVGGVVRNKKAPIEIHPLFALDERDLAEKLPAKFTVEGPLYLHE